jgi:hypothetical protein
MVRGTCRTKRTQRNRGERIPGEKVAVTCIRSLSRISHSDNAVMTSSVEHMVPNIPPSVIVISTLAECSAGTVAPHASSTRRHSYPLSAASRIVVCTQISVHTPHKIKFLTPLLRNNSSKSVKVNAPFVGLSITGSLSRGVNSGIIRWPRVPRMRSRPRGPSSPMPRLLGLLRLRKSSLAGSVERSGRWPSRVW